MERRVERLLNFALSDQPNKVKVGCLCKLLRQCLQLQDGWCMGTIYALKKQFGEEFGLETSKVEDRVCECEWVGVHGGGPSPTRSQEIVSRVWTGLRREWDERVPQDIRGEGLDPPGAIGGRRGV